MKNSGSEDKAQDVFQEAMIIFYQKAMKEEFELTAKIKTFIFAISRNLWLKKLRDNKKITDIENYENIASTDDNERELSEQQETIKNTLVKYLNELGDPCKKLLVLYYYDRKKMEEISDIMGYSNSNSAKNQKYKCLQRLKKSVPLNLLTNIV
jgi:RNA polymerase sigma factor (sigma-70 family)